MNGLMKIVDAGLDDMETISPQLSASASHVGSWAEIVRKVGKDVSTHSDEVHLSAFPVQSLQPVRHGTAPNNRIALDFCYLFDFRQTKFAKS